MSARAMGWLFLAVALAGCHGEEAEPALDSGVSAPEITSVSPAGGSQTGNTSVSVRGTGFESGAKLYFGTIEAQAVSVVSRTLITAKSPPVSSAGKVDVTVKNPNGLSHTLPLAFEYDGSSSPTIVEALVRNLATVTDSSGNSQIALTVTADAEITGITPGSGEGAGVTAQVGYAAMPLDLQSLTGAVWVDAHYVADADGVATGDLMRDRYEGQIQLPGATGRTQLTYAILARFSIDDGSTWVVADRDGSKNGVLEEQLPKAAISRPSVEWCKLGGQIIEGPPQVTLKSGQLGPVIYAQVYRGGVTNAAGAGANIVGELGYGPTNTLPSEATWVWAAATYNVDTGEGSNDEYQANLPVPAVGTYSFAYRFSVSEGPYLYCDANGSDAPGYSLEQAGSLVVTAPPSAYCHVLPPESSTVASGALVSASGRVFLTGVTSNAGAAPSLRAQVGVGAAGVDASSAGGWTWAEATFSQDVAGSGEDEFSAAIHPAYTGARALSFRYSLNNGAAWTYCDANGNDVGGYETGQQPALTVGSHNDFGYCVLQHPTTVASGAETIYGRVYQQGLTEGPGAGEGIIAELGYGSKTQDPGVAGWTWIPASFFVQADNNDEFSAQLGALAPGNYDYAFRFRKSAQGSFCFGDLDGHAPNTGFSGDGTGGSNLGLATIP